ncbi:MAG: hypothetical protein R3C44_11345 [Chloroflexota bacterium]
MAEGNRMTVAFTAYLGALARARRAEPHDDLISRLLHAEADGNPLTEQEIISLCAMLLFAGHETTVNLIRPEPTCSCSTGATGLAPGAAGPGGFGRG